MISSQLRNIKNLLGSDGFWFTFRLMFDNISNIRTYLRCFRNILGKSKIQKKENKVVPEVCKIQVVPSVLE